MSFTPLAPGLSQSLLGAGNTVGLSKATFNQNDTLYADHIHGPARRNETSDEHNSKNNGVMILIIISAIIFVTIVSIYDVIRNAFNNYYAAKALEDPRANNAEADINRTLIANYQALIASIVFCGFCIFTGLILLYILSKFI